MSKQNLIDAAAFHLIILFLFKVVLGDDQGFIKVYDQNYALIKSFRAHSYSFSRIKQLPNNGYVITCAQDNKVKVWDMSLNWLLIRTYSDHSGYVTALEYLNTDLIVSGSWDGTIKMWFISTGQTIRTINTGYWVYSLLRLNDGIHFAAGINGVINIYNINTGNLNRTLSGHTWYVFDLVQIRNDLLASSAGDNTVRLWNLTTNANIFVLRGHTNEVVGLRLVTFDILASSSYDSNVILWNITSGQLMRTLQGHTNAIYWSIDLVNNGQTLVSCSQDQTIKFWNWQTGQPLNTLNTGSSIRTLVIVNSATTNGKNLFLDLIFYL